MKLVMAHLLLFCLLSGGKQDKTFGNGTARAVLTLFILNPTIRFDVAAPVPQAGATAALGSAAQTHSSSRRGTRALHSALGSVQTAPQTSNTKGSSVSV
jgi:hypothetical protein